VPVTGQYLLMLAGSGNGAGRNPSSGYAWAGTAGAVGYVAVMLNEGELLPIVLAAPGIGVEYRSDYAFVSPSSSIGTYLTEFYDGEVTEYRYVLGASAKLDSPHVHALFSTPQTYGESPGAPALSISYGMHTVHSGAGGGVHEIDYDLVFFDGLPGMIKIAWLG
jgi:hypothetical protein